jgi:hypothetical protein
MTVRLVAISKVLHFVAFPGSIIDHISQNSSKSPMRSTTENVLIVCKGLMHVLVQEGHYEYLASRVMP